jgi:Cellulose-binding protein Sde0182, C-terminal domain
VADYVIGKDERIHSSSQATIWRWRNAYQGDFAARMQWTLGKSFQETNHPPVIILNGDSSLDAMHISADFGATIHLDASASWDPDVQDTLRFRWLHYGEPSSTQWTTAYQVPQLEFKDESDGGRKFEKVSVKIPREEEGIAFPLHPERVRKWGPKTYHLILEVLDDAEHPMRIYKRVLVHVGGVKDENE